MISRVCSVRAAIAKVMSWFIVVSVSKCSRQALYRQWEIDQVFVLKCKPC
jgi:hypothetical protein